MIRLTAVVEIEGQMPRALTFSSAQPSFLIGRDASCDFVLPVSTVSRQHARIQQMDGLVTLEDLGSSFGTQVNQKSLQKGEKHVLHHGDMVIITQCKISVELVKEETPSVPVPEGTQELAAKAVQGILGQLGEAKQDGPYVKVLQGPGDGMRFPFGPGQDEWFLGRSVDCDFVINDPNISRRHAVFRRDWKGFTVADVQSKNGIRVNQNLLQKPRRLRDKDEIVVGPTRLVFVDPDADLLAVLEHVPGFGVEASHVDHVPTEEIADEPLPGQSSASPDHPLGAAGVEQLEEGPFPPPNEDEVESLVGYEEIDPALLVQPSRFRWLDWLVLAIGLLMVVVGTWGLLRLLHFIG